MNFKSDVAAAANSGRQYQVNNPIRDYLYLDIDRVRSIYAQASGGLTESIRELQQEFDSHSEEQENKKQSIGQNIMFGSGRIATRVFHDYLFTAMEKLLGDRVVEISKETFPNFSSGSLFRITGKPEIDDYERMLTIMQNYNDMQRYLMTVGHSQEIQNQIWDIKDELRMMDSNPTSSNSNNSKKKRKELESSLEQLAPEMISTTLFEKQRAGISPLITESFRRVYGLMYNDVFEVKIVSEFDKEFVVRGILNREYLREDPTSTYAKYGSRPSVNWTMVGQVTSVKLPANIREMNNLSSDSEISEDNLESETEPDLRQSFENLYATIANVEEFLIGPGTRATWIATPLAIYHEVN